MKEEHPILSIEEVTILNKIAHRNNPLYGQWLFDGTCIICNRPIWEPKEQRSGIKIRIHGRKHIEKLKAFL